MRQFWTAWALSIGMLIASLTLAIVAFNEPAPPFILAQIALYVAVVLFVLMGLVCSVQMAVSGTTALKQVLSRNLATFIAFELDMLSATAQQNALTIEAYVHLQAPSLEKTLRAEALGVPTFFEDREEIRNLLGRAAESTLLQILESLESYNDIVGDIQRRSASTSTTEGWEQAVRLRWAIGQIQDRIRRAAEFIAPFCMARA